MSAATVRHTALLGAVSPFELSAGVRALAGFSPCAGEQQITGGTVRKAFAPAGHGAGDRRAVVAEIGPRPDGRAGVALAVGPTGRSALAPRPRWSGRCPTGWGCPTT